MTWTAAALETLRWKRFVRVAQNVFTFKHCTKSQQLKQLPNALTLNSDYGGGHDKGKSYRLGGNSKKGVLIIGQSTNSIALQEFKRCISRTEFDCMAKYTNLTSSMSPQEKLPPHETRSAAP